MDVTSRRIVGFALSEHHDAQLAYGALAMAVAVCGGQVPGVIMHTDQGSEANSPPGRSPAGSSSGLMPSLGSVGGGLDNAMMESFWSRMQTELLNRKRWRTRTELASEMFQYLEIFHNRQRRHSQLGYLTPVEYERLHDDNTKSPDVH